MSCCFISVENESSSGGGGTGDVVGPASSTDNAVARFDGTTGKLLQNSGVTIGDTATGAATMVNVDASGITTGFGIDVNNLDLLSTGSGLRIRSNSADATGRNLAFIRNQNALATGTTCLAIQQDSNNQCLLLTNTGGTGNSLVIANSGTGNSIRLTPTLQTNGAIISIPNADSLTTGNALNFVSNSADVSIRALVFMRNQNVLATSATVAFYQQDSSANAVRIDTTANGTGLVFNSTNTSNPSISFATTTQTTGNIINLVSANSLTTGGILQLGSNSASNATRNLVAVNNSNAGATGTTVLNIQQSAAQTAVSFAQNANATCLNINGGGVTTSQTLNVISDALTTGSSAQFNSNSADASNRSVVVINNLNSAATQAVALSVSQNSTAIGMSLQRAAVSSASAVASISDQGTGSGSSLTINKSGGSYGNNIGLIQISRTGSYTGVNGETGVDLNISPNFTMTEPGAGAFNLYGANISMASVAVTAGAGTSIVAALNLVASTDTDIGSSYALQCTGSSLFKGRVLRNKANDIVAAATLPAVTDANAVVVTGNTNIDFFPTGGWTAGSMMTFQFTGTPTVNNNTGGAPGGTANFQLAGGVGFGATNGDTLTVYFDGGSWREIGRAVI